MSVVETTKEGYVNNQNLKVSTCILCNANHILTLFSFLGISGYGSAGEWGKRPSFGHFASRSEVL